MESIFHLQLEEEAYKTAALEELRTAYLCTMERFMMRRNELSMEFREARPNFEVYFQINEAEENYCIFL